MKLYDAYSGLLKRLTLATSGRAVGFNNHDLIENDDAIVYGLLCLGLSG